MAHTTIDDQAHIFILINTFRVNEGQAAHVVASLQKFTEEHTKSMPGFVGASVHISLDRTTVVNYVQWQTRAAFDAMFASRAAQEHMRELKAWVASVNPMFYEVVYVGQAAA
jgi:heme-degrading monooxygenase HmoA